MEPYASDDEQVEALKNWWKTNGFAVLSGILIGLTAVLGWQYWNARQAAWAEQASQQYTALIQAVEGSKLDEARHQAQVLLEKFSDSTYAVLGALQLARLDIEKNDPAAALANLEWALSHSDQEEIKTIARLRLARVLLAEGRYDEAESRLNSIPSGSFTAEVEELKGDLYLARNEPDRARLAYQAALTAMGSGGGGLLQLKLDNLPPTDQE